MAISVLKEFFMWCSIFNGAIFILWSLVVLRAPDWIFSIHGKWFELSKQNFDQIIYALMGLFKIFWLFFNIVPYIVLTMMA